MTIYLFPYFESVHCSMSYSNCCFLTCIQVSQEAGMVVWYFHFFKNCPLFFVIHTVKGSRVAKKQKQMFFWNSVALFYDPTYAGNLISGFSAFSKTSFNIWKFSLQYLEKINYVIMGIGLPMLKNWMSSISLFPLSPCYFQVF